MSDVVIKKLSPLHQHQSPDLTLGGPMAEFCQ